MRRAWHFMLHGMAGHDEHDIPPSSRPGKAVPGQDGFPRAPWTHKECGCRTRMQVVANVPPLARRATWPRSVDDEGVDGDARAGPMRVVAGSVEHSSTRPRGKDP